jgi:Tryptophan halogenase
VVSSLGKLEIADRFKAIRPAERVCVLSAWSEPERVERPSILEPHGPGWHVDRLEFDRLLVDAAEQRGIAVHRRSRLQAVERTSAGMRVTARAGRATRVVRARLLIDATGRRAIVARALGARWLAYDRLVGFIGRAAAKRRSNQEPGGSTLVVEALTQAALASLPLQVPVVAADRHPIFPASDERKIVAAADRSFADAGRPGASVDDAIRAEARTLPEDRVADAFECHIDRPLELRAAFFSALLVNESVASPGQDRPGLADDGPARGGQRRTLPDQLATALQDVGESPRDR